MKNLLFLKKITPYALALILAYPLSLIIPNLDNQQLLPPWEGIGGCGAGGSGGGAGDGVRWIGEGISGHNIETEIFYKNNVGQNFNSTSFNPHFTYKTYSGSSWGIALPFVSKNAEVQYRSNQTPTNKTTGGLGDITFDFGTAFGGGGNLNFNSSLTIPTGQYDIQRGPDAAKEYLPASLQKGGGLYNFALSASWTKDVAQGMWLGDFGYSHPFNVSWSGENSFLSSRYSAYKNIHTKRFYYYFKPYGENDLGAYTPPSFSTSLFYADRSNTGYVQSFGLNVGIPLGVAWIANPNPTLYDPKPDPDHKMWNAVLVYGLEMSNPNYPIFLAFSLPIHDKRNNTGNSEYHETDFQKWDGPDWSDVFQQWNLAVGIKFGFY